MQEKQENSTERNNMESEDLIKKEIHIHPVDENLSFEESQSTPKPYKQSSNLSKGWSKKKKKKRKDVKKARKITRNKKK